MHSLYDNALIPEYNVNFTIMKIIRKMMEFVIVKRVVDILKNQLRN